MKLNTKSIRQFLALSAPITVNNIIPIYGYIKIEDGRLTKTNGSTYVVHKIMEESESLLLDEKVLSAFLKDCRSEEFEVTTEGREVFLKEGKRKMKFQSGDIKYYPVLPDSAKEDYFEMTSDVLMSLGVAAKNTATTGLSDALEYVHISKGYVIASDRTKFYCRSVDTKLNLVLDTQCCNIISQFQDAVFFQRGKYNFFEIGNTLYGFIQSEAKTPNFEPFIPKQQNEEFLDVNVADILGFCETFMAASGKKDISAKWEGNELSFSDTELDIDYKISIETEGAFKPDINFAPRLFAGFFKSLGISKVRLCNSHLNNASLSVWDTEDDNFSSIIIGTM